MFIFIQSNQKLACRENYSSLSELSEDHAARRLIINDSSLLVTDLPVVEDESTIAVFYQGHPSIRLNSEISQQSLKCSWRSFGTRFIFHKSDQRWSVDSDGVGVFPLYLMQMTGSVMLTDRLRSAVDLAFDTGDENGDWICDMLLSGFPHDSCTPFKHMEKCPVNCSVHGKKGAVTEVLKIKDNTATRVLSDGEAVVFGRKALDEILSAYPKTWSGIHLTGGYDSRLVLSGFLRLGIRPKTFIFGVAPNYNSKAASMLADQLGLDHHFIPLGKDFSEKIAEYYWEAVKLSDAITSPSHTHYYYATKEITQHVETLATGIGGGELHRGFLEQNVAFPWLPAIALQGRSEVSTWPKPARLAFTLFPELTSCMKERAASLLHGWKKDTSYSGVAGVVMRNVFGNYFRSIMKLENTFLPTYYPYLDPRFSKVLLQAPYGPVNGKNFTAGPIFKLKSQAAIVKKYLPGPEALLSMPTDKGFPPKYLLRPWFWPFIPIAVRRSRKERRSLNELNNRSWLKIIASRWRDEIKSTIPEINLGAWNALVGSIADEYEKWMVSRVIHISATRKFLK